MPHTITGHSPAELLFGCKYHTGLLETQEPANDLQLWQYHEEEKAEAKQKHYKDAKSNIQPQKIQPDHILLLQRQTKSQSQYGPNPYAFKEVQSMQIIASRQNKYRNEMHKISTKSH